MKARIVVECAVCNVRYVERSTTTTGVRGTEGKYFLAAMAALDKRKRRGKLICFRRGSALRRMRKGT